MAIAPDKDRPRQSIEEPSRGQTRSLWRAAGAGMGLAGTEGIAGYLHPALGEALAAADIITPVVIAVVLLTAILFGSKERVERVFRLLRWIANRPEPVAPFRRERVAAAARRHPET